MKLFNNYLETLIELLYMDPEKSIFPHVQASIILYIQRIIDLLGSIGVGYFAFDSHKPYSELRPRGSPKNPNKNIRGRKLRDKYIYHPQTPAHCVEASQTDKMGSKFSI